CYASAHGLDIATEEPIGRAKTLGAFRFEGLPAKISVPLWRCPRGLAVSGAAWCTRDAATATNLYAVDSASGTQCPPPAIACWLRIRGWGRYWMPEQVGKYFVLVGGGDRPGGLSTVRKGVDTRDGTHVAVKFIDRGSDE